MNMQPLAQCLLRTATSLAAMPISRTGIAGLPLPIWPIIGVHAAAPSGVFVAGHADFMGFIEAFLAAILILGTIYLIALTGKCFSASATNHFYLGIGLTDDSSGALPRTTTLARTEVVFLDGAGRDAPFLAAPITGDNLRRELTFNRTVMLLFAIGVPIRPDQLFAAAGTMHKLAARTVAADKAAIDILGPFYSIWSSLNHFPANTAFRFHRTILTRYVSAVKSGSERVGAGLSHWLNEPRQLELNGA